MNNFLKKKFEISFFGIAILTAFAPITKYITAFGVPIYFLLFLLLCIYSLILTFKVTTSSCICITFIFLTIIRLPDVIRYDAFSYFLQYLIQFIVLLFFSSRTYKESDVRFLVQMFIYSGVLTSFCILLLGKPYRDDEGTLTRHIRYSYRLIGPEIQNNQLATYIASVSPFVFYNFIKRKKIIDFIFFIIIFYGTYKTGSRAAILSIVLSVVIIFLSSINSKRIKYVYYIAFILFTIILFLIMPSSIKDRYFDFNKYQDGSNAIRLIWWTSALHLFSKKPLIGYGPVTTDIINMDITGLTNVVHNSFLSILVQYGIIGFFVFLLIPINLFIKSVKNKNILVIAALANICFACLLIEGTLNLALWIILIISTMIVQIKNEEKGLFQ